MATRFIHQAASVADEATGSHAGIGVDRDTGELQFNADGTNKRTVVTTDQTQTLTGKTINGAVGTEASEVTTAANIIAASESGTTFYLNSATGRANTLPAPAAGLVFRFVVGATPPSSGNHTIVTTSGANIIQGQVGTVPVDDAGLRADDEDTITLVASQALEGDWVELRSDGTNYYVSGMVNVIEALTFTAS